MASPGRTLADRPGKSTLEETRTTSKDTAGTRRMWQILKSVLEARHCNDYTSALNMYF